MTLPRQSLISLTDTPYYHCVSRCVRRAFLCGNDHYSGKSYEHRREWLEYLLLRTANVFAIRLCAYAVKPINEYHQLNLVDNYLVKILYNKPFSIALSEVFACLLIN